MKMVKEVENVAYSILLVDDNQANLTIAKLMFERIASLKNKKFLIFLAVDGEQALEKFQKIKHIKLTIMDCEMPKINGF
jgi:CheY-like chemotaxis protein